MALSQQSNLAKVNFDDLEIPIELQNYLTFFLSYNHPGDQDKLYHNISHTFEVAEVAQNIISQFCVANKWRVLVWAACLLHDLDPDRITNTPPNAERTLRCLENNQEIKMILDWFCDIFGFTVDQLKTLILATDYDTDPKERKKKWSKFILECKMHFKGEFFLTTYGQLINSGIVLGEILAYSDKLATYVQPIDIVYKRIQGLAFELRTLNNSHKPTKDELIQGTGSFIHTELFENSIYRILPEAYKQNLLDNLRFFK